MEKELKIGCDLLYTMSKYFYDNDLMEDEFGGEENLILLQDLKNLFRENNIKTEKNEFILKIKSKEEN